MTGTTLDNLRRYVSAAKKAAAVAGHSTDNDTNQFEMGKAAAYQDVERLLSEMLEKKAEAEAAMTYHVENNITGARASRDFPKLEVAEGTCRSLNLQAGPGGLYGVYDKNGERA